MDNWPDYFEIKDKQERLNRVNIEISDYERVIKSYNRRLEEKIQEAKDLRRELQRSKFLDDEMTPEMRITLEFINENPSCSAMDIREFLGSIDEKYVSTYKNMMLKLRRNRGLIINKGSRQFPKWHVSDVYEKAMKAL